MYNNSKLRYICFRHDRDPLHQTRAAPNLRGRRPQVLGEPQRRHII